METKNEILAALDIVAKGLSGLSKPFVFIGGSTVPLYLDQDARVSPRPTFDIDCVVEAVTWIEYNELENQLRNLGFKECIEPNAPRCRRIYKNITVDIMPSDEAHMGFSNRWYKEGLKQSEKFSLPSQQIIQIFSLPYFILSKLEAVFDRGTDLRFSKDLEDIILIASARKKLKNEFLSLEVDLKNHLSEAFKRLANNPNFEEGVYAHILPQDDGQQIIKLFREIAG